MKRIITYGLTVFLSVISHSITAQRVSVIDSLEAILVITKEDTNKVQILNDLGAAFNNTGNYDKTLQYSSEALLLSKKLNFKRGMATAYHRLGNAYTYKGNYIDALKNHFSSAAIKNELADRRGIAYSYNSIGVIYLNQDKYSEAMKYHTMALKIRQEINDTRGLGDSYNNIGVVFKEMGNYSEAIKNYYAALKFKEEAGNKQGVASSYINIGSIYELQNNYPEAEKYFSSALETAIKIQDRKIIGDAYLSLGNVYHSVLNEQEALNNYKASLKIKEEIGDKKGVSDCYINIGCILQTQGNDFFDNKSDTISANKCYDEALQYFYSALKLKEEIGHKSGMIPNYINIGQIFITQQKFDTSRTCLNYARVLAAEIGNNNYLKLSYQKLAILDSMQAASIHTTTQNKEIYWKSSLKNYQLYSIIKDTILNAENNKQIAEMQTRFETEKKDKEIELLNKENELNAQQLKINQTILIASRLESEKKENQIKLLNKTQEVHKLQLENSKKNLLKEQLEAKSKTDELMIARQDKTIKEQEVKSERLFSRVIIGSAILLLFAGTLLFWNYYKDRHLEKHLAIAQERKRISTDMHDDLGSGLSKIALLSEIVRMDPDNPHNRSNIEKISASAKEALEHISEIVWSLNPKNDTLENLTAYLRKYSVEYFEPSGIICKVNIPDQIPPVTLPGIQRRNVFLSVKEALHNVVKHSEAKQAEITFVNGVSHFQIHIHDDGKGFKVGDIHDFGNGLTNMKKRMADAGGTLRVENHIGTTVQLAFPVNDHPKG